MNPVLIVAGSGISVDEIHRMFIQHPTEVVIIVGENPISNRIQETECEMEERLSKLLLELPPIEYCSFFEEVVFPLTEYQHLTSQPIRNVWSGRTMRGQFRCRSPTENQQRQSFQTIRLTFNIILYGYPFSTNFQHFVTFISEFQYIAPNTQVDP